MEIIRGVKYIHTVLLYIIFLEEKIAQIDAEIDLYVIIIPYITNTVFCSILRHICSSNYCTCSKRREEETITNVHTGAICLASNINYCKKKLNFLSCLGS